MKDTAMQLDEKYVSSVWEKQGQIFDKLDSIETESDFRKTMASL